VKRPQPVAASAAVCGSSAAASSSKAPRAISGDTGAQPAAAAGSNGAARGAARRAARRSPRKLEAAALSCRFPRRELAAAAYSTCSGGAGARACVRQEAFLGTGAHREVTDRKFWATFRTTRRVSPV
jgi:hypothetical protein